MLEITFNESLSQVGPVHNLFVGRALTPGGPVFPLDCLSYYDLEKGIVVLKAEYEFFEYNNVFMFHTSDPCHGYEIWVHKRKLVSIKDLSKNEIIYSSTA